MVVLLRVDKAEVKVVPAVGKADPVKVDLVDNKVEEVRVVLAATWQSLPTTS